MKDNISSFRPSCQPMSPSFSISNAKSPIRVDYHSPIHHSWVIWIVLGPHEAVLIQCSPLSLVFCKILPVKQHITHLPGIFVGLFIWLQIVIYFLLINFRFREIFMSLSVLVICNHIDNCSCHVLNQFLPFLYFHNFLELSNYRWINIDNYQVLTVVTPVKYECDPSFVRGCLVKSNYPNIETELEF